MSSFPELPMPEVLLSPEESARATAVYADWSDLVARIRSGQTDGIEELYWLFSRGIRFYLARQLGTAAVDALVHDTLIAVVQAIRSDELREPERLIGFLGAVVQKQAAAHRNKRQAKKVSNKLRQENPEEAAAFRRKAELIDQVMAALSQRDREILTRLYLHEESQDQICKELSLTESQLRLVKSRAKAHFEELVKDLVSHGEQSQHVRRGPGEITIGASFPQDVKRILPVIAHAVGVFGDEKKASHWLATPLPLFGDRSPSQLLEGQEGTELVEQVLTRIEHNIPS
jgi:RNA polymerase sigma-70 factor (ECF subfamily)